MFWPNWHRIRWSPGLDNCVTAVCVWRPAKTPPVHEKEIMGSVLCGGPRWLYLLFAVLQYLLSSTLEQSRAVKQAVESVHSFQFTRGS